MDILSIILLALQRGCAIGQFLIQALQKCNTGIEGSQWCYRDISGVLVVSRRRKRNLPKESNCCYQINIIKKGFPNDRLSNVQYKKSKLLTIPAIENPCKFNALGTLVTCKVSAFLLKPVRCGSIQNSQTLLSV